MNPEKILLLGATGPAGQQVLNALLEKNYKITTLVRNPAKLTINNKNLEVITGDVLDRASVENVVAGKDAVISTLGVGESLKSNNLITNAVTNIIPAMQKSGTRRLILVSAYGVGPTIEGASFLQRLGFGLMLKDIYKDKGTADELIRKSPLDYTLVCPVKLTNSPSTGKYLAGEKFSMSGFPTMSRADLAQFIVKQLTDSSFIKKTVVVK